MMAQDPRLRVKFAPKKIIITNKSQIRFAVSNYMPNSDNHGRKMLVEGFSQVKDRLKLEEQYSKVDVEDFGDFKPLLPKKTALHWVDRMIDNSFGAIREGLLIVWKLGDGKHSFDPFTGEIKYDIN